MNTPMSYESETIRLIHASLKSGSDYEREKVISDWLKKPLAAEGIYSDFVSRAGNPSGKRGLDIGFGNGVTLATFARGGAQMSGVEVSKDLFLFAEKVVADYAVPADLHLYDGEQFPFEDETFDFIYSVSVLEHVSSPESVLKQAARVLKKGGVFYLAFPNRFFPKETHTGLWFISYLPASLASRIAVLFGRSAFDVYWNLHFLSYFSLTRILKRNGISLSVQLETKGSGIKGLIKKMLGFFGIHHSALLPHVMVVLRKD